MSAKDTLIERLSEMFRFCYSEAEMDSVFKGLKIEWENSMEEYGLSIGDKVEITYDMYQNEPCVGTIEAFWNKNETPDISKFNTDNLDPVTRFLLVQPNKFEKLVLNDEFKGIIVVTLNEWVNIKRLE